MWDVLIYVVNVLSVVGCPDIYVVNVLNVVGCPDVCCTRPD